MTTDTPAETWATLKTKARFAAKVDVRGKDECWEWRGARRPKGYGNVGIAGRKTGSAHRLAWELEHGRSVPAGMFVCHRCDNPPCVNPAHLFLGSHRDNVRDMVAKGRSARGEQNWRARLSEQDVAAIRGSCESQYVLAERYGVRQPTISRIKSGQRWKT